MVRRLRFVSSWIVSIFSVLSSRHFVVFAAFPFLTVIVAASSVLAQDQLLPSSSPNVPLSPRYKPPGQQDQSHSIKSSVDLVVLHVSVADAAGQFVANLKQDEFHVFENKIEQKISVFSRADIPVTMGLVIDNSGSMREKREQVNAAALTFVRTSNPEDEVFVVNFNDEYYLDTDGDFTCDQKNLENALSHIDTRGSTALYDAVNWLPQSREDGAQG